LGVGAFVTIGLVGSAFALVYRAQRELEAANLGLEARIQARTDEVEAAAKRVRDSEQRLQFLADHIPQLVWTARADGIIASLNQGWRDYLGVATEAEAVRAYANAVHPDDLGATVREWERMMREGRPAGGEARLRRADGQYRWHLWRAHPERNEKGEIVRWVGTWTDIHDQKTAEAELGRRVAERTAELVASEERFRQAFELAGIGMGIVGMDGQWLRVNKSLSEFTGYAETELLGKKMLDLTYPEDAGVDRLWREELAAGQRRFYAVEKRFVHRDGRLLWVRATVSAIRDSAGTPVQFVVQVQDISAQKQLAGESISAAEPRHQSASES